MRNWIRIVLAGIIFAICGAGRAAERGARPNLLFLLADDQRWDSLGCAGNAIAKTPNLDQLAARGVLFRSNFVATAICCVSRANIFTGQYARRHKINDFATPLSPEAFAKTYPALLRKSGYRVGFIGKWGLGGKLPEDQFDYFDGFEGQGTYFHEVSGKQIHLTRLQAASAIKFFREGKPDLPFCLSVSFKAPHSQDGDKQKPFRYDPVYEPLYRDAAMPIAKTAEPPYFEKLPAFIRESEGRTRWKPIFSTPELYQSSVKDIYRLVTGIDDAVGEMLTALEELNLAGNTIIIFTSDNGFLFSEHGLSGKWLMYEESIRTPLIVMDPRLPAEMKGLKRNEMTLNIDFAPTMLEMSGLEIPREMQGRSLVPLLRNQAPDWRKEWYYDHLFDFGGKIPRVEGVRTEQWSYARYIDSAPLYEELFDLKADPLEENNLAAEGTHQARLEEMRGRWQALRASSE